MTHKKPKQRKLLDSEFDCPYEHPQWKHVYEKHDFEVAQNYLSLIMPLPDARAYRKKLWELRYRALTHYSVDEILRASLLPLLPIENIHVKNDIVKVDEGTELSPLLLIRGNYQRPLYIADGYHRMCASYHLDENTMIPSVII